MDLHKHLFMNVLKDEMLERWTDTWKAGNSNSRAKSTEHFTNNSEA